MATQDPDSNSLQSAYRIGYLLAGFIKSSLTEAEVKELNDWRQQNEANERLFQEYTNPDNVRGYVQKYAEGDTLTYLERSKAEIRQVEANSRRRFWRNIAAGVIGLSLMGGIVFMLTRKSNKVEIPVAKAGVDPVSPSAVLTVNGDRIINIAAGNFDTVFSNGVHVFAKNRELFYPARPDAEEQHVLSVPPKGFFRVMLPDGTRVRINSNSSIRYSTVFSKSERRVILKGEAYFEVAPDKEKPFRVECAGGEIEAVGTAFNVKADENEKTFTTTLTEGKVRIRAGNQRVILQPGEQVVAHGNRLTRSLANTKEAIEWSKKEFVFDNMLLSDVMRELSHWYGVEVEYKMAARPRFNLSISRDSSLSQILALLEKTNEVHFTVKDEKIIVTH